MFKRLFAAAIIFGAAALAPPLSAQPMQRCAERDSAIETLKDRYGERLAGIGLRNSEQIVELWASDQSGTFTILVTRSDGLSCILTSGVHWDAVPQEPEGTES